MPFGQQKVAVKADISDTKSCLLDKKKDVQVFFCTPFIYHNATWVFGKEQGGGKY